MAKTKSPPRRRKRYFPLYPIEVDPDLSMPNPSRSWHFPMVHTPGGMGVIVKRPQGVPAWTHLEFAVQYELGGFDGFSGTRHRGYFIDLSVTHLRGNTQTFAVAATPTFRQSLELANRFSADHLARWWETCIHGYLGHKGSVWEWAQRFQERHQLYLIEPQFLYPPFAAAWRSDTVCALERGIFRDKAFDRLPILADALEEAGCDSVRLLAALRADPESDPVGYEILLRCLHTPEDGELWAK